MLCLLGIAYHVRLLDIAYHVKRGGPLICEASFCLSCQLQLSIGKAQKAKSMAAAVTACSALEFGLLSQMLAAHGAIDTVQCEDRLPKHVVH